MQKEIKQGVKGRNQIERRNLESFLGLVGNDVKKAKTWLEMKPGESIKDNKSFWCSISSKKKKVKQAKCSLLLNGVDDLVTDNAGILNALFASAFTKPLCFGKSSRRRTISGAWGSGQGFSERNCPMQVHVTWWNILDGNESLARVLNCRLWKIRKLMEINDALRKANGATILKIVKKKKKRQRIVSLSASLLSLWKSYTKTFWKTSDHMKEKVTEQSQHGFTKES